MSQESRLAANIDAVIGERVRSRRMQAKMSQAALGEAVGVTLEQIQKYEEGTDRIGSGRLLELAKVLECDVMEFYVTGNGDQTIAGTPLATFMATRDGVAIIKA